MKVSIIIPCFNAIDKIGRCIASLKRIKFDSKDFEIIFIDDCSNDGTYELLNTVCRENNNWSLHKLNLNSGSPSKPRNFGITMAQGTYIYFVDCDDEVLPNSINDLYQLANNRNACVVRAELLVYDGKNEKITNTLPNWNSTKSLTDRVRMIIQEQSTTVDSFIRKDLLLDNNILWPENLRMGEDSVFLAKVLAVSKNIEFLAAPVYCYYKVPSLTPASTQRYGRKELSDHIEVWSSVQNILKNVNVDYFQIRLNVGLRVCFESLIFKNRGDVDNSIFEKLSKFVNKNWIYISKFSYNQRYTELLYSIKNCDYVEFLNNAKPRLLIAGHDLKFITEIIPKISIYYDIRIDEWTGHNSHDVEKSLNHLSWAEYIWCEWLLGNAEWYSENKRKDQILIVRMHRMELGRNHGEKLNMANVDAIVAVSVLFFERLLERYQNISRDKIRLIHNYIDTNEYKKNWSEDRLFTLGIIGILPSRKGFKEALRIIKSLRIIDSRFKLKVFGKLPEQISWVSRDEVEMSYFNECMEYISKYKLSEAIDFVGHVNIKNALEEHSVGYVLSVSEPDDGFPGPESFHLAIADGFAGGGISFILNWQGAEFVWPSNYIFNTIEDIISEILKISKNGIAYNELTEHGRKFVENNYSSKKFIESFRELFLEFN